MSPQQFKKMQKYQASRKHFLLCFALSFTVIQQSLAFVSFSGKSNLIVFKERKHSSYKSSQHVVQSSSSNYDAQENNIKRTCIKQFLTQRSVQSFMFLLEQCRDPHTVYWMENFSDSPNVASYHGTGAFNITRFESWDSFLMEMAEREKETIIVSARRRGAGTGGWSTNNPYLKPRFVEFEIDIDPPSLATRLLSVREQISKEWVEDLDLVVRAGTLILESYFINVERKRDNEEVIESIWGASEDFGGDEFSSQNPQRQEERGNKKKTQVFERTVPIMMNNLNPYGESSSPFRKGNFDLLNLLATQESVHRLLRKLKESGSEEEASFTWLRDFYTQRIPNFFDGNQNYGRYDDFLEELLLSNPTIINKSGGKLSIIDPVSLTEKIIRLRRFVAEEWKQVMENTPTEHIDLHRDLFHKKMQTLVTEEPEEPMEVQGIVGNEVGEFD